MEPLVIDYLTLTWCETCNEVVDDKFHNHNHMLRLLSVPTRILKKYGFERKEMTATLQPTCTKCGRYHPGKSCDAARTGAMTAGPCKRCGAEPSPSKTFANCLMSETGQHEFTAVPVSANPHHHTISSGDKITAGADGHRCVKHRDNDHTTCRACLYAAATGGVNHLWMAGNPGAHTQSVLMDVPTDWKMKPSAWDDQVGGQHYKKGIQPFEYAMANELSSLEFSVVKYLRKKGDKAKRLEDLRKAKHCLEMLIEWEEKDGKI